MSSLIGPVGHIYGLDTVKKVQDWISTGGTSNRPPQENCKTTQDFSCVKIDYDQKLTIELEDFLKNRYKDPTCVPMMMQSSHKIFFQMNKVTYQLRYCAFGFRCLGGNLLG